MTKKDSNYYSNQRPEIAKFVPHTIKSILDVGCGDGNFLKLIKFQTGAETWGIELEPKTVERAKMHVDHVVLGRIEDVVDSIPDGYFDCITFNDLLEHLIDPKEVLVRIKKKLSHKGVIIASIPNVLFFDNLYDLILRRDWEYKDAGILDRTHLRFFTKKSAVRMFEEAGYQITRYDGINKKNTWKFKIFNILTIGFFDDTKNLQYVYMVHL